MQPRALGRILQLPVPARRDQIALGLELLHGHVAELGTGVDHLAQTAPVAEIALTALMEEEAAKALILLDVVRMDEHDDALVSRQLKRFYNHLARCIYAEVAWMHPGNFQEISSLVDQFRQSHYLDGPNDTDWIFRNQLLTRREESLYVDYVADEDGRRWTTPGDHADGFPSSSPARDLVGALQRLGCTSRAGLDVVAEHWNDVTVTPDMHWQENAAITREILTELHDLDLWHPDATPGDASWTIDTWSFPMGTLELAEASVMSQLQAERDRQDLR